MEPKDFDREIKYAEKLGATEVDILWTLGEKYSASAVKGKLNSGVYSRGGAIGVRAVVGKRIGIAGGTLEKEEDVMKIVEKAVKVAKVSPEDPDWNSIPTGLKAKKGLEIYDKKFDELSSEDLIEIAMRGVELLKEKGTLPISAEASAFRSLIQVANSNGESVYSFGTYFALSLFAKVKENGREGGYSDYQDSRRFSSLDPEKLAEKVAKRAKDSCNAKRVDTGKYEVIFEGRIGGRLLSSALFPAMSAESVQKNRSPLKGKVGERIFSENVNFLENPHRPWDPGSRPFDGDGKETKRYYLVKEGILRTYYYDDYTAKKEGKESTGNSHRSISGKPRPWINNVVFEPGDASLEEIIQETKRGVLICSSIGYWLSNPVSGQMSGTISHGYLISNGEIAGVVKGVAFADNVYEALKERLIAIGKELEHSGSVLCPPYKISGMTLAGDRWENFISYPFIFSDMKLPKAIILDLDMTLLDTLPRFFEIYNRTREKFGLKKLSKEDFIKRFEEDSLSEDIPQEVLREFWREFRRRYCDFISEEDHLIPGALELLKKAKEKGLRVIVTTGRECLPEKIWEELEYFGIAEYVDGVYTLAMGREEDEKVLFYRRSITELAMKEFNLKPEDVVFVADYLPDMECGRDLGIYTIGVLTGKKRKEDLYCHGASVVLKDILEVGRHLGLLR